MKWTLSVKHMTKHKHWENNEPAMLQVLSGQLPLLVELLEDAPPHFSSCLIELICNCAELPAAKKVRLPDISCQWHPLCCFVGFCRCSPAAASVVMAVCCYNMRLHKCVGVAYEVLLGGHSQPICLQLVLISSGG